MTGSRKSVRLQGFDYASSGAYFVTICTFQRQGLFGEIANGMVGLNEIGKMVLWHWNRIPTHFKNVELDEYIIMPNHLHGIICIADDVGAKHSFPDPLKVCQDHSQNASPLQRPNGTESQSLCAIVQNFKSITARKFHKMHRVEDGRLWQRNYYEHVIRNENELNRIREYIIYNPVKWDEDKENPKNW